MNPLLLSKNSVDDMYVEVATYLGQGCPNVQDSRNGKTKEFHPANLFIYDFSNYFLTVKGRVINFPFALAELIWIMSGSDEVWIADYNKQMLEYVDDFGDYQSFNAAYGKRIRRSFNVDQIQDAILHLSKSPDSRHAALIMRDPYLDSAVANTKDRACNIASLYLIRGDKLHLTQLVRSQDFIWGSPYNFMQFGYITQWIAENLKVEVGSCSWISNSLHVYDKHWEELDEIRLNHPWELFDKSLPPIGLINHHSLADMEFSIRKAGEAYIKKLPLPDGTLKFQGMFNESINTIEKWTENSPFWHDGLLCLAAYWLKDSPGEAMTILTRVKSDLFRFMILRYFIKYWGRWRSLANKRDSIFWDTIRNLWHIDANVAQLWLMEEEQVGNN